jgi:hypothetical protein
MEFVAPQRSAGVAFTGMLDLPRNLTPIRGEMSFQWTFPNASELLKLGGEQANAWAIAAVYIRGRAAIVWARFSRGAYRAITSMRAVVLRHQTAELTAVWCHYGWCKVP